MLDPSKAMVEKVCATWILFDEGVLPQIKVVTTATVGSFWWHQPKFPASIKWKPLYEFAMHLHFLIPPPKKKDNLKCNSNDPLCHFCVSTQQPSEFTHGFGYFKTHFSSNLSPHGWMLLGVSKRLPSLGVSRGTPHRQTAGFRVESRVKFQLAVCHRISVFIYIMEIWHI